MQSFHSILTPSIFNDEILHRSSEMMDANEGSRETGFASRRGSTKKCRQTKTVIDYKDSYAMDQSGKLVRRSSRLISKKAAHYYDAERSVAVKKSKVPRKPCRLVMRERNSVTKKSGRKSRVVEEFFSRFKNRDKIVISRLTEFLWKYPQALVLREEDDDTYLYVHRRSLKNLLGLPNQSFKNIEKGWSYYLTVIRRSRSYVSKGWKIYKRKEMV